MSKQICFTNVTNSIRMVYIAFKSLVKEMPTISEFFGIHIQIIFPHHNPTRFQAK